MNSATLDRHALDEVLGRAAELAGDDRDFFLRVWSTDPAVYRQRIRAAGFAGLGEVLDAGCGFGQWTLPLAEANRRVTAIDVSELRIRLVRDLAARFGIANIEAARSGIEATPYPDASFDGIFCYSVLYFTDYRESIAEFARLLRPGGRLYLCSNGLGWYLHNLVAAHNASATFDPAAMAVATLENSLDFFAAGRREAGKQIVTPSAIVRRELEANGLEVVAAGAEGTCSYQGEPPGPAGYEGRYCGAEGGYGVIARKPGGV